MAYRATRHLTILNAERLVESLGPPHTICVTGHPRGGTSAVALLLRELGLFMGEEIDPRNHEDIPLQRARGDPAAFAAIARRYDAAHKAWGFKLPVGSRMGRALLPLLRNPVQIVVARNPVAVI
ncbi:MAG: hypothetical protein H7X93_05590, partial [Sphingomonadaceae bacterium]|nr:hypothetical protein [Sphingomonadaceae bacterium]